MRGEWKLNEKAMDLGVEVELVDTVQKLLLGDGVRDVFVGEGNAGLGGGTFLLPDVER